MSQLIDLTGQSFYSFTALEYVGNSGWLCKCKCGNKRVVHTGNLKTGNHKSCGCYQTTPSNLKHGMSKTKLYKTFWGIRARCTNPNERAYKWYGAQGIKCLWDSFEEFRDDMQESYTEHVNKFGKRQTSLDRIDNGGNYCKENCRWATLREQGRNRRNIKLITYKGKTQCMADWERSFGFSKDGIGRKLRKGLSFKQIVEHK